MLARWIATVAALLLACAQASAHVRTERAADLGTFAAHTEHALEIERATETAAPGELPTNPKTAPPARASLENSASGENAPLTHCHAWENWSPLKKCASGVDKYLYGNGNPGSHVDPTGQYAESGHYYTVFLAAKEAGYSTRSALKIALYAQLPDEVGSLDAVNQQVSNATGGNGQYKYTWNNEIQPGQQYVSGREVERTWVPNEFSRNNVHRGIHQLTGGGSVAVTGRSRDALIAAESDEAAGIAAHALGDSYAHREIGKEKQVYPTGTGHLRDGTRPDMIVERPELYGQYTKDLVQALAKRRGEPMTDAAAEAFARSMMEVTTEPLKQARARIREVETSGGRSRSTRGFAMSRAEGQVAAAIKERAAGMVTEADNGEGAVLLAPEAASPAVWGSGTAGHEQEHLRNFWAKSIPSANGIPRPVDETIYASDQNWEHVKDGAWQYMRGIGACDGRDCER